MDTKKDLNKTHKRKHHKHNKHNKHHNNNSSRKIPVVSKHFKKKYDDGTVADIYEEKYEGKPSENEYVKGESIVVVRHSAGSQNATQKHDSFCPKLTKTRYRMLELIQKIEKKRNYNKITKQFPEKWRRVKELYVMLSKLDDGDAECEKHQTELEGEIIKILEFFKKELQGRGSSRNK